MNAGWDAALAWLREQMDEDERVAQATILKLNGGQGEWTRHGMEVRDDRGHLIVRHTWPNEGDHITRQDPATVLRRVEADRRLLAWVVKTYEWAVDGNLWSYDEWQPLKLMALRYVEVQDFPEVLRLDQTEMR